MQGGRRRGRMKRLNMKIVKDGYSLIIGIPAVCLVLGMAAQRWSPGVAAALLALGLVGCLFMLYFFRDPERTPAGGPDDFVSAAEGVVRSVEFIDETRYLKCPAVRISVFLNPFNVHVNRHALSGVEFRLGYNHVAGGVDRATLWHRRETLVGRLVKFKHQPSGAKDAPRFPKFVGFREAWDMGA